MPYWDHKEETQGIASPLCGSYNKGKCQVCLYDGPGFSLLCDPPPHTDCLKSLGESRKVCTPLQGDNGFSVLTGGTFTFKTVSPTTSVCNGVFRAHLRCLQLTGTVIGPVSAQGTLNRSLPDVITPPKGHPSILYGHQTALTVPSNCKRQRQPH